MQQDINKSAEQKNKLNESYQYLESVIRNAQRKQKIYQEMIDQELNKKQHELETLYNANPNDKCLKYLEEKINTFKQQKDSIIKQSSDLLKMIQMQKGLINDAEISEHDTMSI